MSQSATPRTRLALTDCAVLWKPHWSENRVSEGIPVWSTR